jgi:hypothetical protein
MYTFTLLRDKIHDVFYKETGDYDEEIRGYGHTLKEGLFSLDASIKFYMGGNGISREPDGSYWYITSRRRWRVRYIQKNSKYMFFIQ